MSALGLLRRTPTPDRPGPGPLPGALLSALDVTGKGAALAACRALVDAIAPGADYTREIGRASCRERVYSNV